MSQERSFQQELRATVNAYKAVGVDSRAVRQLGEAVDALDRKDREIALLRRSLEKIHSGALRDEAKANLLLRSKGKRQIRANQLRIAFADIVESIARKALRDA